LNIAITGGPGSGKSQLAKELVRPLSDFGKVIVVDRYIEKLERDSNIVCGQWATYIGNLQCALARFAAERKAIKGVKEDFIRITCGSIIESSIYTAANAYALTNNESDWKVRRINDIRSGAVLNFLGMLKHDSWDYDLVFYLPLDEEDKGSNEHRVWETIDENFDLAAESFEVSEYVVLQDRESAVSDILQELVLITASH